MNRLREIPLFAALQDDALRDIAPFVEEASLPAGSRVIREGDFAFDLMAIQEGEADVLRGDVRVGTLGPGDVFGEIAVLDRSRRSASVVARTPLRVVSLSHWYLRRLGGAIDELRAIAEARRRPAPASCHP